MRILWVADKYIDISVDSVTWIQTSKELMALGHDVRLITGYFREKKKFGLNGHVHYLPSIKKSGLGYPSFTLALFFYLAKALLRDRPDIVIVHPFSFVSVLPWVILSRAGLIKTRFVMDIRTVPVEYKGLAAMINEFLFKSALKTADRLFHGFTVITPCMRTYLRDRFRLRKKEIGIWTSGVAIEHFDPAKTDFNMTAGIRKEWRLSGKFVVMYHGVLTPSRGLLEAIEAMKIVSKKNHDIVLLLIGKGFARELLENKASDPGLNGQVQIRGPVEHARMPDYLALSDVGILPFPSLMWWRVSSPIKLMEYLAMEKPVIVTDIEAHRDVLNETGIGLYVENNQPDRLAAGILQAYGRRKSLELTGIHARALAASRYTWKKQAARLAAYLEEAAL